MFKSLLVVYMVNKSYYVTIINQPNQKVTTESNIWVEIYFFTPTSAYNLQTIRAGSISTTQDKGSLAREQILDFGEIQYRQDWTKLKAHEEVQ